MPVLPTFRERAERELTIVDKTDLLYHLIQRRGVTHVVGPRRYGKIFNLTTLQAIFEKGKEWWDKYGKKFWIYEKFDFPQHPMLSFNFNSITDLQRMKNRIYGEVLEAITLYSLKDDKYKTD